MIQIVSKEQKLALALPTSLNEITPEYLENVTKGIKLADYHCVVAIAQRTNLFEICSLIGAKKNEKTVSISMLMAKTTNDKFNIGDVVLTDRSSIERGIHVNCYTGAASSRVIPFLENDATLRKNIMTGEEKDENGVPYSKLPVYILEFKILPMNSIYGCVDKSVEIKDAFAIRPVTFKEETNE